MIATGRRRKLVGGVFVIEGPAASQGPINHGIVQPATVAPGTERKFDPVGGFSYRAGDLWKNDPRSTKNRGDECLPVIGGERPDCRARNQLGRLIRQGRDKESHPQAEDIPSAV